MSIIGGYPNCGPYDREHDFGAEAEHEERGVLVVTHGKRAGRIYVVEKAWTERTCSRCKFTARAEVNTGNEWPGGIR